MLAQFDHPALIKVFRFWEANKTAYMVMPFLSGLTLQDALKQRGEAPGEAWIRALLSPLMDALAVLHEDKVYHRDIAPDNIMLLAGDRPVLLDFGAARRVISDMTHALTVILKPGYAPIEQYADMPGMKQGPWTDVYALAAVVYFMILKRKPPAAVGRLMEDSYEPLLQSEAAGRYSAVLLQGIDRCLRVRAEDRPQSMAAMREASGLDTMQTVALPPAPAPAPAPEPDLLLLDIGGAGPRGSRSDTRSGARAGAGTGRTERGDGGRFLGDRLRRALSVAGSGPQLEADARRHRRAGRAVARGPRVLRQSPSSRGAGSECPRRCGAGGQGTCRVGARPGRAACGAAHRQRHRRHRAALAAADPRLSATWKRRPPPRSATT
jgi:hypothetical protein